MITISNSLPMNGPAREIENFRVFGDTRLQNHIAELETRYQNREVDEGLKQQAYSEHRRIFQKELSDKMEELLSTEDEFKACSWSTHRQVFSPA